MRYYEMDSKVMIGEGTFGKVYAAHEGNRKVAIKEIKPYDKGIRSLLELSIMNTYQHPHLAHAIKISITSSNTEDAGSVISITQDLAKYDLKTFMTMHWKDGMKKATAKRCLYEIISAIDFLHLEGIIHCDIKPHNVLVFENCVKLCDCGGSVIYSDGLRKYIAGTTKYSSPEMLLGLDWNMATDIWSLACLFHEVLTGKHFMASIRRDEVEHRKRAAKSIQLWREDLGEVITNKIEVLRCLPINFQVTGRSSRKLILQMTRYDPSQRPTIYQIMGHAWFGKLVGTKFKPDITGQVISNRDFNYGWEQVAGYIAKRNLDLDGKVLYKAAELYSRLETSHQTVEYLETCLTMSCKIHQSTIPHFHPATSQTRLVEVELLICQELDYRLHKCSCNNLYIPMG